MLRLNSQLQKIKKEDITIYEYLAHIKEVFDKYSTMGEPLSYGDKLMYTLNGLIEEYDGFVTSIYNRCDKPSLEEVHSLLYTYEYQLEQRNIALQLQFPQVNLTAYSDQNKFHKNQQSNFPKYPQSLYSSFAKKSLLISISHFVQTPNLTSLENLKDNHNRANLETRNWKF